MSRPGRELTMTSIRNRSKCGSCNEIPENSISVEDLEVSNSKSNDVFDNKSQPIIVRELLKITRHVDDMVATETTVGDWQFAASVIDRLCCIIFAAFLFILTLAVFLSAPSIVL